MENNVLTADKLSRQMVTEIPEGSSILVKLPDFASVMSARVTVGTISKLTGNKYATTYDSANSVLQITRV